MNENEIEQRLRTKGRTGRWTVILVLLLLLVIFFAAQFGLRNTRPDNVEVIILPQETANYSPWDPVVFNRVDPIIGTQIAQDFLATALVSEPLTPDADGQLPVSTFIAGVVTPTPTPFGATLPPDQATQAADQTATQAADQTSTQAVDETATSEASTGTPAATATDGATETPASTETDVPTDTPVPTETETPVPTNTPNATGTAVALLPSSTPLGSPSPTFAPSQTPLPSNTPAPIPTNTPIPVPTNTPFIPAPIAAFTFNQITTSPPFQVNFNNTSTGSITDYNWFLGDGNSTNAVNPTHFYGSAGTYTVTLTVTGPGGTNSATQTVVVTETFTAPVALFTTNPAPPVTGDAPLTVNFIDQSTGPITTYNWTFGDGANSSSTQQNPSFTYNAAGTYIVTLTVSGPGGVDTFQRQITVQNTITAGFTFAQVPGTLTVNFTNTSTGNITGYTWDFGDTFVSTAANPSRAYTAPGTYTVTLVASGPADTDTFTQTVTVSGAPVAGFTVTPGTTTVGSPVAITNTAAGDITTTTWTFGDGNSTTGPNPGIYTYNTTGTFTITQTVTGPGGTDNATQTVTVDPPVVASFNIAPDPVAVGDPVTVTNTSTGTITTYDWDFGDGDTSTAANPPQQTYAAVGTYTITLTVTGATNTDTATQTIQVVNAPVAAFTANPTIVGVNDPITLTNNSTGDIDTILWDFDDGGTSNIASPPPYDYATAGNYTITLTVSGPGGTDSVDQLILVVGPPTAAFTFTQVSTADNRVNFTNGSTVPGGSPVYEWDFDGDGLVDSNAANPTFDYPAPGTYNVTLTVTGPGGMDSVTQSVPVVQAAFDAVPLTVAVNEPVDLTNTSAGPITGYTWDFGDTNTSTAADPGSHTYTTQNTFTITLRAFSATGDFHEATRTVDVLGPPDVRVTIGVNQNRLIEGQNVTYTIRAINDGPSAASGISVSIPSPADFNLQSNNPNQGTYAADVWTVGALNPGTQAQLQLVYQVGTLPSFNPAANAERTTTATVTITEADPNPGNNSDSQTVRVSEAQLGVTMTVDNPTPNPGQNIVYTINVTNNGDRTATNVAIGTDITTTSADQVTYVSHDAGTFDGATGTWSIPSIASGATATINVTAVIDPAIVDVAVTKTASITASDQYDAVNGNNSDTASIFIEVTDLRVNKTVSNNTPLEGDTITYTIEVRNIGLLADTNVVMTDILPAEVTYVSNSGGYNQATGEWNIGAMAANETQTLTITVTVDPFAGSTSVTNTATVTGDRVDFNLGNNTDSATFNIATADLVMNKTAAPGIANIGDQVDFTLTLTNNGPNNATGVTADDILPTTVDFVSAVGDGTYDDASGVWTVGAIANGASATLTITVQVNNTATPGGTITNTASVTGQNQYTASPGSTDSATITVPDVDLRMLKAVDNPVPNNGAIINYTLTVENLSTTEAATNVQVTDMLPAGVTFNMSAGDGAYDNGMGIWTVGTVPAGGSATITLTVNVTATAGTTVTNTAVITVLDQSDTNTLNNTASIDFTVPAVDIQVEKAVDAAVKNLNDPVTYTLTVTNNGADTATNVTIQDMLPPEFVYVSDSGGYDVVTSIWTIGTLGPGGVTTLTINGTVAGTAGPGTTVTNVASLNAVTETDTNGVNNSDSVAFVIATLDVVMSKSVNPTTANVGDVVTYTLRVTNNSPTYSATNVTVTDVLPTEVTFDSTSGAYDNATGIWTVGTLAPSSFAEITITVTVNGSAAPGATVGNTASITTVDQFDSNNTNDSATANFTVPLVDLAVSKIIDNPLPNRTDPIEYRVFVNNAGPNTATGVQIFDLLPAEVTYVSDAPSQGTYDNGTGLWDVGTLGPGATAELVINATVNPTAPSGTPIINTASVDAVNEGEVNTGNNSASASFSLAQADLELGPLTPDNPNPLPGQTVNYTATLTNNGPQPATGITVSGLVDTFDVSFLGVGAGNSTTITLTETIPAAASPGPQTYIAEITAVDQFDPDSTPANGINTEDDYQETLIVVQSAVSTIDLGVSITVDNPAPTTGATVTYTIITGNGGPSNATGVSVVIPFMAGELTYVSDDSATSGTTFDPATGVWTIGTINAGLAGPTLVITATVDATSGQEVIVNATISGAESDTDITNDTDSASFTVP